MAGDGPSSALGFLIESRNRVETDICEGCQRDRTDNQGERDVLRLYSGVSDNDARP